MRRVAYQFFITCSIVSLISGFPAYAQNLQPPLPSDITITVESGTTLSGILKSYGLPYTPKNIGFLARYNSIYPDEILRVGARLSVPLDQFPDAPIRRIDCTGTVCFEESFVKENQESTNPLTSQAIVPDAAATELATEKQIQQTNKTDNPIQRAATTVPASNSSATYQQNIENHTEDTSALDDTSAQLKEDDNQQSKLEKESTPPATGAEQQPTNASSPTKQPVRPPGIYDIDEEAAARALERTLVQVDALLLAPKTMELSTRFAMAFDEVSVPALIETFDDNGLVVGTDLGESFTLSETYSVLSSIAVGLPFDSQIELEVPYNFISRSSKLRIPGSGIVDSDTDSVTGFGDLNITLSKTLQKEKGIKPDLITSLSYNSNTGENVDGINIGTGHEELSFGLSATRRQDPLVFNIGINHTIAGESDDFKPGSSTILNFRTLLAASPKTSLSFAFSQNWNLPATLFGDELDGSDSSSGILTLGVSSVISSTVFLSAGVNIGLNSNRGFDYAAFFRLGKRVRL